MHLPKEPWEGGRCATSKMWDGSEQDSVTWAEME